jgi:transcriptional regulator with XRE-family HTH domain
MSTYMSSISTRLREERKRLRLSQGELADLLGIHRNSQARYERGEREPDTAYLEAIGKAGVDVGYVLAGVKSDVFGPSARLEADTLDAFAVALHIDSADLSRVASLIAAYQAGPADQRVPSAHGLIDEVLLKSPRIFDPKLLEQIIEGVENVLSDTGRELVPAKKARTVAMIYRTIKRTGNFDYGLIYEAVKLAAD